MFKLLQNRIFKKEQELKLLKSKLKGHNIRARCMALMRLEPLKTEISELKTYIIKRAERFRKKRSTFKV